MTSIPGADSFDRPPTVPTYDSTCLGALLPGIARALGVTPDQAGPTAVELPSCRAAVVVLIDGMGWLQLGEFAAHAPFLATLFPQATVLRTGCPSTTATAMGSFGTGLPPGRHGLVGYEVMDPDRGVLLNELRWHPATDPLRWQPYPTMFERLDGAGIHVVRIGNPEFDGSGLTMAALRGGDFVGVKRLTARVREAAQAVRRGQPTVAYLYWGDLDAAGHVHGCPSSQWLRALRHLDRQLARLASLLPGDVLLAVTADHGMVDVPPAGRVDLADEPDLARGVTVLGGEARFAQAYCVPGAREAVADRFADAFGDFAWVRTREEAIDAGWFGPVDERVRGRIGDVVVAARDRFGLVDSRTMRPAVLALVGQHGSLTEEEQLVPLLVHTN